MSKIAKAFAMALIGLCVLIGSVHSPATQSQTNQPIAEVTPTPRLPSPLADCGGNSCGG
jgi:hypothetical protein